MDGLIVDFRDKKNVNETNCKDLLKKVTKYNAMHESNNDLPEEKKYTRGKINC